MESENIVPVAIIHKDQAEKKEDVDSGADINSESGNSSDEERNSDGDLALTLDVDDTNEENPVPSPRKKSLKKQVNNFLHNERLLGDTSGVCPLDSSVIVVTECQDFNANSEDGHCNHDFYHQNDAAVLEISSSSVINNNEFNQNCMLNQENVEFYNLLVEGLNEAVDNNVPIDSKPDWLDLDKFKRGQKFAIDYLFCVNFAEMSSLLMLFSFKNALEPLIFSGKSHTPFKSFQRYLSTLLRIKSWYEHNVWEPDTPARKNMIVVRGMHKSIKERLDNADPETLEKFRTLGDENKTALWCPLKNTLLDDFIGSCPMALPGTNYEDMPKLWVNQTDMFITQFGFVGLVVTYPEYFGCGKVSVEDLEAFVHMWRGLGYLLGIKDKYNFCNGGLETVRKRTKNIIQYAIKPNLRDVTPDWEHMSRCMIEGISYYVPGVTFEVSLQYLCDVLRIHTPRLRQNFSFYHKCMYYVTKFVFSYVLYIPGMLAYHNWLLMKAIHRAQNASPEFLNKLQNKSYDYMKQIGKSPIHI